MALIGDRDKGANQKTLFVIDLEKSITAAYCFSVLLGRRERQKSFRNVHKMLSRDAYKGGSRQEHSWGCKPFIAILHKLLSMLRCLFLCVVADFLMSKVKCAEKEGGKQRGFVHCSSKMNNLDRRLLCKTSKE